MGHRSKSHRLSRIVAAGVQKMDDRDREIAAVEDFPPNTGLLPYLRFQQSVQYLFTQLEMIRSGHRPSLHERKMHERDRKQDRDLARPMPFLSRRDRIKKGMVA